jgi:hypothetical protein
VNGLVHVGKASDIESVYQNGQYQFPNPVTNKPKSTLDVELHWIIQ